MAGTESLPVLDAPHSNSSDEFLCVRCSKHRKTCCQVSEIFLTVGDLRRIAAHSGRDDFHHFVPPTNPVYQPDDEDPLWRDVVFRSDGTRRTMRRRGDGDCTFLGPQGCTLPLDVRPLLCRIYPFDFTEQGILPELAPGCPLELLSPGQDLIAALDMRLSEASAWHEQLYDEIREEGTGLKNTQCLNSNTQGQGTPNNPQRSTHHPQCSSA